MFEKLSSFQKVDTIFGFDKAMAATKPEPGDPPDVRHQKKKKNEKMKNVCAFFTACIFLFENISSFEKVDVINGLGQATAATKPEPGDPPDVHFFGMFFFFLCVCV